MLDGGHRALDALILGDAELVVDMAGADADAGVDAGALGVLERLGRAVDVLLNGAGQAHDRCVVASQLGNAADALEITRAGNGESSFDDVHVQT